MRTMPRPRKPYVQREKTRHKKTVWYFRKGDGPRVRLRGDYESPEWLADYDAALGIINSDPAPAKATQGTLGWLIDRYQDSLTFANLAAGTQKARRSILKRVKETGGTLKLAQISRGTVVSGRDRRKDTPAAAANFVKAMKALFAWAVEAEIMPSNPAADLKNPAPKTEGHHTWTVEEVKRFWARHPVGTKPRLALDILLLTGMRSSDAVLFGRQHVRAGWAHYRSVKTGIEVDFPILSALNESIAATQTGDLTYLVTEHGGPFKSAASFGNWFRKQCQLAKVPGRAHGLRKAGATIAAENGASDQQLMAMWGWTDERQAGLYTRRARRWKLAGEAARMLGEGQDGNILSPHLLIASPHLEK
ncbi:MAG: tyrosine-type recombinase/integrase [Candidatus Devosia phytovorans]|uniref:Tyrosine-type recombinase/integrase n=1 Tax=Candidatus Devosia phytovorans TaxID=3121372 RepID=A0AAJ5VW72_9HYPH|nr:tyrosine-type recombinase/integrase [Devosia sp.]WEK04533.1 MAG: tyrosine-type recombinase/integrase [Devosia sp.]